ncbi:hypothetical protein CPB84DRAFT_665219 [Gymnopilus junonius]|uniref:Uncharacterized protein n=1 Tax=Gymnopilus junonius TaxID=109634 RepID=A0A9P5NRU5_GYMJU|nr:hypothetical protein CPB84DRAFT_665219 [Gymnopilus junonius]
MIDSACGSLPSEPRKEGERFGLMSPVFHWSFIYLNSHTISMAYDYYQQASRTGWGTNQFQFGAPPQPTFQPQPSWNGYDFYRAHAGTADPVREYGGAPAGGMGVGLHEARHWHRRAYGAMNEVHLLAPEELGHAAAYEAYRNWIHNTSLYEPLSGDIERQREALTGLAVAEGMLDLFILLYKLASDSILMRFTATRLLQFSSRPMDQIARLAATEAAAHTASYIFYQTRDGESRSRSLYRTAPDDPYAYDNEVLYPRSRSVSRSGHGHRSRSRHRSYSQSGGMMPFPGQTYPASGPVSTYPGQLGTYGSYAGSQSALPMASYGTPYYPNGPMTSTSAYGTPMGMGVSPSYSPSAPPGVPSYASSSLSVPPAYPRSRSSSFSYSQAPYMGTPMSTSSMPVQMAGMPGQTIVIHKSRKSKKHRHSKRSRSSDGEYRY